MHGKNLSVGAGVIQLLITGSAAFARSAVTFWEAAGGNIARVSLVRAHLSNPLSVARDARDQAQCPHLELLASVRFKAAAEIALVERWRALDQSRELGRERIERFQPIVMEIAGGGNSISCVRKNELRCRRNK